MASGKRETYTWIAGQTTGEESSVTLCKSRAEALAQAQKYRKLYAAPVTFFGRIYPSNCSAEEMAYGMIRYAEPCGPSGRTTTSSPTRRTRVKSA